MPELPDHNAAFAAGTKRQRRPSVRLGDLGDGNLISAFYYDHLLPRQHRQQKPLKRSKVADDAKNVHNDNDNNDDDDGDDDDDDDDNGGGLNLKKSVGWKGRVSVSKGGESGGLQARGSGLKGGKIGTRVEMMRGKNRDDEENEEGDLDCGWKARVVASRAGRKGSDLRRRENRNVGENHDENESGFDGVAVSRGGRKGSNLRRGENRNESGNDDENEGGFDGVAVSRGGRKGRNIRRGDVGENRNDEDVLENEGDLDGVAIRSRVSGVRGGRRGGISNVGSKLVELQNESRNVEGILEGDLDGVEIGNSKGRVSGVRGSDGKRGGMNSVGSKLVGDNRNESGANEVDRNFEPIGSEEEEEDGEGNHDDSDSSDVDGNGNVTGGRGDDNGAEKGKDLRFQVSDEMEDPSDLSERNGVKVWLKKLGLQRYALNFEIHEVDDEVLPLLTLEDLKDMGITAVGSRRKLFCSIQNLNN